jgi:hypothetical protein
MKCVHGIRIDKPCPDCEYEEDCRRRGMKPENRWEDHPLNPARRSPYSPPDRRSKDG